MSIEIWPVDPRVVVAVAVAMVIVFALFKVARKRSMDMPISFRDVFNFDHHLTTPRKIYFGPFIFHVRKEHCENLKKLGRAETKSYELDEELNPTIQVKPEIGNNFAVTAQVEETAELNEPSVLFPDVPTANGEFDLAVLLSFLAGRRVYIGDQWKQLGTRGTDRLVSPTYFYFQSNVWQLRNAVASADAAASLYNICMSLDLGDLIASTAVANSALDAVSTWWASKTGNTKYGNDTKKKVVESIASFRKSLEEQNESADVIDDICVRIPGLCALSAVEKLKRFLTQHGMFPAVPTKEQFDRLKALNAVRNTVAHSGNIKPRKGESFDRTTQIAAASTRIVIYIVRVYIAKYVLQIVGDDHGVDKEQQAVLRFFDAGIVNGQLIFDESYDEFMQRIDSAWMSDRKLEL